jgi:hypothetical protein
MSAGDNTLNTGTVQQVQVVDTHQEEAEQQKKGPEVGETHRFQAGTRDQQSFGCKAQLQFPVRLFVPTTFWEHIIIMDGKNIILSFWEYIIYYLSHRMDGKDEYQQCLMTKLWLLNQTIQS